MVAMKSKSEYKKLGLCAKCCEHADDCKIEAIENCVGEGLCTNMDNQIDDLVRQLTFINLNLEQVSNTLGLWCNDNRCDVPDIVSFNLLDAVTDNIRDIIAVIIQVVNKIDEQEETA